MGFSSSSSSSSSLLLFFYIAAFCSVRCVLGSSICSHEADVFIKNIHLQCSPSVSPIPPLKVFFFSLICAWISGFEPVQFVAQKEPDVSGDHNKYMIKSWKESSPMEIVKQEPYLVFALLFLCLRGILLVFPKVLSRLKAVWVSYAPQFNLEIFGETSQLFARALHMVDVRRVWTKLRLCMTQNFQQGAKSARVWASSLASVSLGESSARSSSSALS
ncbi:5'-adenylylsulfate reductase-like 5 [Gossypium australe]|uniref:5'-adenylylsulfate reductase-like 5 n=1 Tax=Gossypium australe TaxID=47621 RepID=A0A5B6VHF4_9ROSI|nr:5'-adenylylsulfate reductase-like 5 [Gossypium australe]